MDDQGKWHNVPTDPIAHNKYVGENQVRLIFTCDHGEQVKVLKVNGEYLLTRFKGHDGNKVMLDMPTGPVPQLRTFESVRLEKSTGVGVPAVVWLRAGNTLTLRTQPTREAT